ncbi:large exoprotein [Microbacterium oxydans]|nr:large exoprotein [Microbacterium oxydans]
MNDYYGYDGLSGGAVVALILVYTILPLAIYALYSWFYMKIFEKAGVQGKWRAWVPVYSTMIFYKLGDLSPWLVLYLMGAGIVGAIIPFLGWFLILPLVGIAGRVIDLIAAWRVGLKLQKDAVWVVLYFFLPPVWLGINAFDKSRWNPAIQPASWAANGLLGDRTVWDGIPRSGIGCSSQRWLRFAPGLRSARPAGAAVTPRRRSPVTRRLHSPVTRRLLHRQPAHRSLRPPRPRHRPLRPRHRRLRPRHRPRRLRPPTAPPAAPPASPTTPPTDPTQPPA